MKPSRPVALVRLVREALVFAEREMRYLPAADPLRIRVDEAAARSRVATEAPEDQRRWEASVKAWELVSEIARSRPADKNPEAGRVATIARILARTTGITSEDELEARLAALALVATLTLTDLEPDLPVADAKQTGKRRIPSAVARGT